jgi:hypothetical protein
MGEEQGRMEEMRKWYERDTGKEERERRMKIRKK